jgi:hypothetical protein
MLAYLTRTECKKPRSERNNPGNVTLEPSNAITWYKCNSIATASIKSAERLRKMQTNEAKAMASNENNEVVWNSKSSCYQPLKVRGQQHNI